MMRKCPRRQHGACTAVLGVLLSTIASPLVSTLHAQFAPFAQLFTPVGVATDADGHVYISHDNVNATLITKFRPDGSVVGSAQIGGFFDVGALGSIARIPSSGLLLHLLSDGRLLAIDPNNLAVSLLFDIRTLQVDATAIYDILSGTISGFGGVIQIPLATFGDLAVRETPTHIDLFVAGLSQAQAFPFILRIRIRGNAIVEARVLMSSNAETVTDSLQTPRLTRGIGVSRQGIVLTSLPYAILNPNGTATTLRPYDVLVAFPADFNGADGIGAGETPILVLGNRIDVYSQGITSDEVGRFYVVTNATGTVALGVPGEGALVTLAPGLNRITSVLTLNRALTSFRDVAVSERSARVYVTADLFSVGVAADVVVSTGLSTATSVEEPPELSLQAVLFPPAPNPFSSSTTIRFAVPVAQSVRLELFDLLGRRLETLFDASVSADSEYSVEVNGSQLPTGIFVVRLSGRSFSTSRTIVLRH